MTDKEIADRLAAVVVLGRNLGFDTETVMRICSEVEAEAKQAATWGTIEDRIAEIRRRLMKRALN